MAKEDFGTYTQVDPNSRIVVGTRRATWTDLKRNEDAYVYKDKGLNFFDGDFAHYLTIRFSATQISAFGGIWALTNELDDLRALKNANKDLFYLGFVNPSSPDELRIQLTEIDGGSGYADTAYAISLDTTYYLKIVRDEGVGTYGTLYMYTYTDAARTTKVNTQTITLHTNKKDFQYIHVVQTWNSGTTYKTSGYSEDLEFLTLTELLELANTYTTNFTDTSVTGNAYIVNTGISTVTQHGHCWDKTFNPTDTDSGSGFWGKTTLGEGSVGLFSSNVTGLITGQQYYMRAYATNTEGTAYAPNIRFIAGRRGTQLLPGEITVKGELLHYVSKSGVERYFMGTPI